jgi:hypothetical protein
VVDLWSSAGEGARRLPLSLAREEEASRLLVSPEFNVERLGSLCATSQLVRVAKLMSTTDDVGVDEEGAPKYGGGFSIARQRRGRLAGWLRALRAAAERRSV